MTTIKCPICKEESTFEFVPKTQTSPFTDSTDFTSINLELSCEHEFVMLSYSTLESLQTRIKNLEEKMKKL